MPNLRRPKLLVPVHARAASRAAFTRYLTTDSSRSRALGYGSAAVFGSPVGEQVMGARLRVAIDANIPADQWSQWLLLRYFEQILGATDLVGYLPVRRAIPNAKPTMRLFERAGTPQGYAKVGWSEATRAVVRNEASALTQVHERLQILHAPPLAAAGTWHGYEYAIAAPLPANVRPYDVSPSSTPELMWDIVASGHVSRGPLKDSGFAHRVRAELESSATSQPHDAEVLLAWLARLEKNTSDIDFGRWHGDFVPWNLGRTAAGPVAWDWEYSDPDVPVGFDIVHWQFQRQIAPATGTLSAAVQAADNASHLLTALNVHPDTTQFITSLYLLEVFTRAVRMSAAGAGWNRKFYPALVDVARQRDS